MHEIICIFAFLTL